MVGTMFSSGFTLGRPASSSMANWNTPTSAPCSGYLLSPFLWGRMRNFHWWNCDTATSAGSRTSSISGDTLRPLAALTSIGATNRAQIAESPGLVSPGLYSTTVPTGSACIIEVFGGPSRRVRGSSGGPLYMNLPAGMSVSTAGPCVWNKGDLPPVTMPATGDGMYRTGAEIQLGLYTAPGGSDCYWETSDNADGSLEVINDIYYGPGPQLAIIEAGDAYFTSDGCGPWTPLTALPAQYLQVASAIDNYPLQGLRAFYPGSQFTVTATPGVTTFTTPQFTLQIAPPDSGPFTAGDFTVSRYNFTAPGNVLVNVTSPGRGCNVIPGTATISDVVLDVDGSASSMHAIVFAECDGKRFAVNVQY